MQINFHDDGNGVIRVLALADGREVARLLESADGSVIANLVEAEAKQRSLQPRSEHEDLIAAQSFIIASFDPDSDYKSEPVVAATAHSRPTIQTRRSVTDRTQWIGGPKQGTHYAHAVTIANYFYKPTSLRLGGEIDIRDRSPAHMECYELASEAVEMFRDAQNLSRHVYPGARQREMSCRGKGKRALEKAKALFDPIQKADRKASRDAMPLWVSDVVGDTRDLEVALQRIAEKGFQEIGAGGHATVYARSDFDTLRASNGVDGYYRQLIAAAGPLAPFVGVHAPVVMDVLLTDDGGAIALVERLEPLPEEGEVPELDQIVEQAIAALRGIEANSEELDRRYPRFREYATILREVLPTMDYRRENLMMRRGNLIANDPCGRCFLESELGPLREIIPRLPFRAGPPSEKWWDDAPRASMTLG